MKMYKPLCFIPILLLPFLLLSCRSTPEPPTSLSPFSHDPKTAPDVIIDDLGDDSQIHRNFADNRWAANINWIGRRVRITIVVQQVVSPYYITATGPSTFWFDAAHADEIVNLKQGTKYCVEATVDQSRPNNSGKWMIIYRNTRIKECWPELGEED